MNKEKEFILAAHGIVNKQTAAFVKPEEFFDDLEVRAIREAVAKSGKNKGKFKASSCPFGTPGYILQQARIMVFNKYRMPSECIILLSEEQKRLFCSLVNKFEILRDYPGINRVMNAYAVEHILP